jgi:integrase
MIASTIQAYLLDKEGEVKDLKRLSFACRPLLAFFGDLKVGDITAQVCRRYARERGKAQGTVRKELSTLRAAIQHDYAEGRLTAPVPIWTPGKPDAKDRWLTRQEFARLLHAAKLDPRARGHLPLFMLIAIYTAARKEAILSLRWPQVDLVRGLIDFNPSGRERTSKGRPIIPIPARLLPVLKRARKRGTDLGYVIHQNQQPIKDIKHGFASAACNAGLGTWRDRPYRRKKPAPGCLEPKTYMERVPETDVTPHTLRHTAASWMAQAGVRFEEIARYLGHSDSRTTETIYAHHSPDYLQRAATALNGR